MIALLLFSVAWSGTHQPHMRPFFPSIQGSSTPSVGSWYEANLLFLRHISGICWHLWQLPLPPFQIFIHRHSSWDTHYTLLFRDGLLESRGRNASPLLPLLATQLDLVAALPSLLCPQIGINGWHSLLVTDFWPGCLPYPLCIAGQHQPLILRYVRVIVFEMLCEPHLWFGSTARYGVLFDIAPISLLFPSLPSPLHFWLLN